MFFRGFSLRARNFKKTSDPLISEKKKMFGLQGSWYSKRPARTHGFNAKIGFEKYAPSPEISAKTCPKSAFQTKPAKFDISRLNAYFSKPIFALKPWVRAGRFEYHQPYNPNDFFFTYKGVRSQFKLKRGQGRWHPILKNFIFLKSTLKMHPGFTRDKIRKELFWFLHSPNQAHSCYSSDI